MHDETKETAPHFVDAEGRVWHPVFTDAALRDLRFFGIDLAREIGAGEVFYLLGYSAPTRSASESVALLLLPACRPEIRERLGGGSDRRGAYEAARAFRHVVDDAHPRPWVALLAALAVRFPEFREQARATAGVASLLPR